MRIVFALSAAFVLSFANLASATVLTDFTYTYVGTDPGNQPHAEYADDGVGGLATPNSELNDNLVGGIEPNVSLSPTRSRWVGFIDSSGTPRPQPQIEFTFAAAHSLTSISVVYHNDQALFINQPESLVVTLSEDATFDGGDPVRTFTAFPSADHAIHTATFDLEGLPAQYVRAVFLNDGPDTFWTMFTEIDFNGGPVPEPSALVLAPVLLGFAAKRRRR